jgi:hypothetical protein
MSASVAGTNSDVGGRSLSGAGVSVGAGLAIGGVTAEIVAASNEEDLAEVLVAGAETLTEGVEEEVRSAVELAADAEEVGVEA